MPFIPILPGLEITERIRRAGSIFAFVRSLIIVAFHPEQDLMSAFMGKGKSALPAQSMNLSRLNKAQIQKNLICFQRDCPLNALVLYGVLCIGMDHSYPVHEIGMSVDPPALRPSLYAKARVFAIRSCKSNEPKGFKFSKPRGEQKGVVTISNKNLLDPLRAVTGEDWIPGKRYKVRGFWVADAKTMCFDLNEGVQEDFRPVTPSNDAE